MIESCISHLRIGDKKVTLTAFVEKVSEVTTANSGIEYQKLTLTDESGSILLTLFADDCNKIPQGSWIEIKNGYTSEFQGAIQLNKSKKAWGGSITVLESAKKAPRPASTSPNTTETPTGGSNSGIVKSLAVGLLVTNSLLTDLNENVTLLNDNLAQGFKTISAYLADIKIYLHDLVKK